MLVDYKPEALKHPRSAEPKVAGLMIGSLHFGVPGPQVIDSADWDKECASPEFGDRLVQLQERGVLTVLEQDETPTLKNLTPAKAIARVKDTYDRSLLEAWLEDEARPTVVSALNKQITPLLEPSPETASKKSSAKAAD